MVSTQLDLSYIHVLVGARAGYLVDLVDDCYN